VQVIYVTGPLFFGSVWAFLEAFQGVPRSARVILSMRGVPSIDATGLQAIAEIVHRQHAGGGEVHLSGLQPRVVRALERSEVGALLGQDRVHWSADGAIAAVHRPEDPDGASGVAG
jgi:SulP family sulfate permease